MTIHAKPIDAVYSTPVVQQTAYWSEVKHALGIRSSAFDFKVHNAGIYTHPPGNAFTVADFLVLQLPLDKTYSLAYIPYGPEIEPSEELQGSFLEELSENLRPYLPAGCVAIRYDLAWQSHWSKDDSFFDGCGKWLGPPGKSLQELRFNFGTVNDNLVKANTNVLPSHTIFMDLRKNEQQLLMTMKPKTRYNIRLAERKGVTVSDAGMDKLPVWYSLYKETCERNRIHLSPASYFQSVLNAHGAYSSSPASVKLLLAEANGRTLAAMFLVISERRATYLYGASSSQDRNLMAPYKLQWEALKMAKRLGCVEYDFFGIPPSSDPAHPMQGLYQFKTGFGGRVHHSMGCWDYPLINDEYMYFAGREMQAAYHL